jgi:hypothetical protein
VNGTDLEPRWREIETPHGGALAGKAAPDLHHLGVMLAVDHAGLRHLLVPAAPGDALPNLPQTRGLEISVDEMQVGDAPARWYFDVACRDPTVHANFTTLSAEVVATLVEDPSNPRRSLEQILDRWRWFWGTAPGALTDEEALGLFGELWFLEYWVGLDSGTLTAWRGPLGDRHDFKWPEASVEVKATRTRSDGAAEHRISNLDQLEDPERGDLFLFSLRVTADPIANHSLSSSVERIRAALSTTAEDLHRFDDLIGQAGYTPADRDRFSNPLRVVAEELYTVAEGFPRVRRSSFIDGIPPGVDNIVYTLDLGACQPWLVASRPVDKAARTLVARVR